MTWFLDCWRPGLSSTSWQAFSSLHSWTPQAAVTSKLELLVASFSPPCPCFLFFISSFHFLSSRISFIVRFLSLDIMSASPRVPFAFVPLSSPELNPPSLRRLFVSVCCLLVFIPESRPGVKPLRFPAHMNIHAGVYKGDTKWHRVRYRACVFGVSQTEELLLC